jgi:N-acyl-L-homoserine lactone synthetase
MDVVSGVQNGLPQGMYLNVSRYRHQVFVERLGWQLPTRDGFELDQFDRVDTLYVVAQDGEGSIIGCARLLPTTRPYLLGEVFPQLLNGLPPPSSPDVWELSRFAAVDINHQNTSVKGQFSSPIAVRLLQESIACAATHGAKRLITVSPIGVERLLRRAGFDAHRAGPPAVVDGNPIVACLIEISGLSLCAAGSKTLAI